MLVTSRFSLFSARWSLIFLHLGCVCSFMKYIYFYSVTKDHVTLLEFVASIVMRMLSYCFLQVFFANFISSVEWSPWKLWADGNTYIVLFCEFDYSRAVLANCPVMVASVALRKLCAATPRERKNCYGWEHSNLSWIL